MMSSMYETGPPVSPVSSVEEILRTRRGFTRAQLAWLMAQAMRWGYDLGYEAGQRDELALANVAASYAHLGTFTAENTWRGAENTRRRREADAAARIPRIGDHPGGPVEVWGDDEPCQQVAA